MTFAKNEKECVKRLAKMYEAGKECTSVNELFKGLASDAAQKKAICNTLEHKSVVRFINELGQGLPYGITILPRVIDERDRIDCGQFESVKMWFKKKPWFTAMMVIFLLVTAFGTFLSNFQKITDYFTVDEAVVPREVDTSVPPLDFFAAEETVVPQNVEETVVPQGVDTSVPPLVIVGVNFTKEKQLIDLAVRNTFDTTIVINQIDFDISYAYKKGARLDSSGKRDFGISRRKLRDAKRRNEPFKWSREFKDQYSVAPNAADRYSFVCRLTNDDLVQPKSEYGGDYWLSIRVHVNGTHVVHENLLLSDLLDGVPWTADSME